VTGSVLEKRQFGTPTERVIGFTIAAFFLAPLFFFCFRMAGKMIPFLYGPTLWMFFIFVPLLAASVLFGLWHRDFGIVVKLGAILWSGLLVWMAPNMLLMVLILNCGFWHNSGCVP
jgi:hypothetical protein